MKQEFQSAFFNRRCLLKTAISFFGAAWFEGILQAASGARVEARSQNAQTQEVLANMNTQDRIESSWLSRQVGFQLAHEQFPVPELVDLGVAADRAGFDLLAVSDHFQPWQDNEGHSSSAWVTLAALGQRTQSIRMGPAVTCPTLRYNPAVVAEVFASLGNLYPDRIFLGLGS